LASIDADISVILASTDRDIITLTCGIYSCCITLIFHLLMLALIQFLASIDPNIILVFGNYSCWHYFNFWHLQY